MKKIKYKKDKYTLKKPKTVNKITMIGLKANLLELNLGNIYI